MRYVLTSANISEIDREMVRRFAITEFELMERASCAIAERLRGILEQQYHGCQEIAVVCGNGNNGGDGMCVARQLASSFDVSVIWNGEQDRLSSAARFNYGRLPYTIHQYTSEIPDTYRPDVIIDAVLGAGTRLPVTEPASNLMAWINAQSCPVISLDVPSGLEPNTGDADAVAVHARHTITLVGPKVGMLLANGPEYSGLTEIVDFGVPADLLASTCNRLQCTDEDLAMALPVRKSKSSKFDYGRVAVIGGTLGMRGAPALAAHAAIALGAGIVDLIAPAIHPLTPREVITHQVRTHDDGTIADDELDRVSSILARATVVAIGPGVGANSRTIEMLEQCIKGLDPTTSVVLDAEGILCAKHLDRFSNVILTPHMGELSRLLGMQREVLQSTYVEIATAWAKKHDAVVHVKNVPSITTDGNSVMYLNAGTPAMATAGSGDVLTGIVASLCAQGLDRLTAASTGAYLHAKAGESIVRSGRRTLVAHELITHACDLLKPLTL